jgi:hypothetical protein
MTDQRPDDRTAARRAGDTETWDEKTLQALMSTPQGRYWMERLLDLTSPGGGFGGDGTAIALGLAFDRGKEEIKRYLETQLNDYCPDLYLRMIRERRARFDRQMEKQAREQTRRDGPEAKFGRGPVVTSVEDMADAQRAEAEELAAREAKAKQKPKPNA